MNALLAIPMDVRLAALFIFGVCVGSLVNLGVYRLAWHPRAISPWSQPLGNAPPRRLLDRLPIFGWLGLRREAALHGAGFWVRPLLVELGTGLGFVALYEWEIGAAGLLPAAFPRLPVMPAILHCEFATHALLVALMLVTSLIDSDEKTIPDAITVPGTLLGLLLAAVCPWSLLPDAGMIPRPFFDILVLTSPNVPSGAWPPWLTGAPHAASLVIGLGCFLAWCAALLPRSWYPRHGWRRAVQLALARLVRSRAICGGILLMALAGSAAIVTGWAHGGLRWETLLTALVGMAASGGLVWLVRLIGSAALGREAMGFGDVTLMAMIGAFLGWQACLLVFFLAPLAGLVLGLLQLILRRGNEIPYGPFLCLGALATIVGWAPLWNWAAGVFFLGWFVPVLMLGCLVLMALMLFAWRWLRERMRADG